jgi:hypothetical protein
VSSRSRPTRASPSFMRATTGGDAYRSRTWALIDRTRGRIGDHVAELRLVPGRDVCAAKTGAAPWSVWGDPAVLQAAVSGYVDG